MEGCQPESDPQIPQGGERDNQRLVLWPHTHIRIATYAPAHTHTPIKQSNPKGWGYKKWRRGDPWLFGNTRMSDSTGLIKSFQISTADNSTENHDLLIIKASNPAHSRHLYVLFEAQEQRLCPNIASLLFTTSLLFRMACRPFLRAFSIKLHIHVFIQTHT